MIDDSIQEILKGVNVVVYEGEVLVWQPDYEITGGGVVFKGENLLGMKPDERSLLRTCCLLEFELLEIRIPG